MILKDIVATTERLLAERKAQMPFAKLEQAALEQRPPQNFAEALRGNKIKLIAEVKRASPSKGPLALDLDPAALANTYAQNGASAISVLTETEYFKGSLADLMAVRAAVDLPMLRKDFIFDPYQLYEARANGADAVLLIAAVLSLEKMRNLSETAQSLGMQALIEVHDRRDLERALELNPCIIGINNRNLNDFKVSLDITTDLRPLVPDDVIVVSESGIQERQDVEILQELGVNAILVGEALVISDDPARKIKELMGT